MTADEVTVIVPFYNAARTIVSCIESIKRQGDVRFSAILVDDGSKDSGLALALGAVCDDARFRVLSQDNAGVSAARNLALQQPLAEYLVFLDSDDLLPLGALRSLLDVASPDVDLVYGSFEHFRRLGPLSVGCGKKCWGKTSYALGGAESLDSIDLGLRTPWAKLYRTEVVRSCNIKFQTELPIGEDTDFNLSFCMCAKGRMTYTADVVYRYALDGMASSIRFHSGMMQYMAKLCSTYSEGCELFSGAHLENIWVRYLEYALIYMFSHCSDSEARSRCRKGISSFLQACEELGPGDGRAAAVRALSHLRGTDGVERFLLEWEKRNKGKIVSSRIKLGMKKLLV